MEFSFDPLSFAVGGAAGLVAGFLALWPRLVAMREKLRQHEETRAAMGDSFSVLAQDALRKSGEDFLLLAQEKLKQAQTEGAHDLEKRQKAVAELVDPIGKSLKEMAEKVETLGKTGAGLDAQLKNFAEDQRLLRQETHNLVTALRNPAARGRWGELQLQRALEMIGMVEGTHFTQQETAMADGIKRQPDFVVSIPGGLQIVIDVKTPVEPYWQALENAGNEAQQTEAMTLFRRHVRDHLKSLSAKEYWRQFDAPEFVVMFLPTEGLYSMAVSNDPALIEEAARHNIILASPTTLMGLLRIVMHGWREQKMAEEARTVSELASELYRRIAAFGEHMQKLGRNLNTALGAYNQAVGSLESSVLPGARKFRDLHVQTGGRDIPELAALEETPRALSALELTGDFLEEKPKKIA